MKKVLVDIPDVVYELLEKTSRKHRDSGVDVTTTEYASYAIISFLFSASNKLKVLLSTDRETLEYVTKSNLRFRGV